MRKAGMPLRGDRFRLALQGLPAAAHKAKSPAIAWDGFSLLKLGSSSTYVGWRSACAKADTPARANEYQLEAASGTLVPLACLTTSASAPFNQLGCQQIEQQQQTATRLFPLCDMDACRFCSLLILDLSCEYACIKAQQYPFRHRFMHVSPDLLMQLLPTKSR